VLRIFGRDAWLCEAETGPSRLAVTLARETTGLHLLARWDAPGPIAIEGYYRKGGSNSETEALCFYPYREGLFSKLRVSTGSVGELRLWSDHPPDRFETIQFALPTVSTAASILPAYIEAPADPISAKSATHKTAKADFTSIVGAMLRDRGLTAALKLFTYSRSGIPDADVVAAARTIFVHLAQHPFDRDPLLGAFLASLCGEAARQ
jgi:hypothetical protein